MILFCCCAIEIWPSNFPIGPTAGRSGKETALARPDELSATKPSARNAGQRRNRPRSAGITYRERIGFLVHSHLADQIARPRQNHRPSAQTFLGQVHTLAPENVKKPKRPLIQGPRELNDVLLQNMYAGFAGSMGRGVERHDIWSWSFENAAKN
ncbi:unnamed protein product [Microthlaspi erraticum]|uniref:Legume lectin domain-containing protein n=1 Tax=Microthlaspi erraticum TaxID=1685480 RepID=A0A6D2ISE8_9BRAS|nr:unnamed protein product [Microthlaspi erraticum]